MTGKEIKKMALAEASALVANGADRVDLDSDLTSDDEEAVRAEMRKISDELMTRSKRAFIVVPSKS